MVNPESIQGAMAESEQELTHELTAVRAQLQQVVSRLGSIAGKKIRFSLWQNLVCSLNLTFLCLGSQRPATSTSNSVSRPGPSRPTSSVTAVTEHQQLFSRYAYDRVSSYPSTKRKCYTGKGKGVGKGRIPTCTLKFVCLAEMDASTAPSTVRERTMLSKAGLGEKAIQLFADASPVECHDRILEHFPKLAETGYEMLLYQRGVEGGFFAIDQPYSPKRLKDAACSAKIFLRPLQKDLEVEPTAAASDVSHL